MRSASYRSRCETSAVDPNHHCERLLLLPRVDRCPNVEIETIFAQRRDRRPDLLAGRVEKLDDHLETRGGDRRGVEDRASQPRPFRHRFAETSFAVRNFRVWNAEKGMDTARLIRRRTARVRRVNDEVRPKAADQALARAANERVAGMNTCLTADRPALQQKQKQKERNERND